MASATSPAEATAIRPGKVLATESSGSFARVTTKFWVPLDRLETVKARISKNIPIYKFDKNQPVPAYTNSVYMDSTDLSCYYNRLRRVEDAFLIRLRWYANDYNKIFVERKVHHESWGGEVTVKSRFTCHAADVPRFLSGEYELESLLKHGQEFREREDAVTALFNEFREKITNTRLFPILRTKYARTAFQYTPHVDCRASLDEDLQMMLEPVEPGNFRRDENTPVREDQVLRFPYAVFELKVENPEAFPDAWPDWVQEMVEDGSFIEVYKYSKFLTGIAWLLPEKTTVNPSWLSMVSEKVRIIDPYHQRIGKIPRDAILSTDVINSNYELTPFGKKLVSKFSLNNQLLDSNANVILNMPKTPNTKSESKAKVGKEKDSLTTPLLADLTPERGSDFSPVVPVKIRTAQTTGNNDTVEAYRTNYNETIAKTTFPEFPPHLFEGKPILVPMKVEPKVYFSNERTHLHWAKFGATVAVVGIAIEKILAPTSGNGDKEKITGLILAVVGLTMMCYGAFMFRWRLLKIMNRERGPFYDKYGPSGIVSIFVILLIIRLCYDAIDTGDVGGAIDMGNLPCT